MSVDDKIKHVILLVFENRSYDHILGSITERAHIEKLNPDFNASKDGTKYYQKIVKLQGNINSINPPHSHEGTIIQFGDHDNGGFVKILENDDYPVDTYQQVMNCFDSNELFSMHYLAKQYGICRQWYSSVPGPTRANRSFIISGTSKGSLAGSASCEEIMNSDQDTIFDRLDDNKIDWKIYAGDVPMSLTMKKMLVPEKIKKVHTLDQFFKDVSGQEKDFPQFSFIEPNYVVNPSDYHPMNDDIVNSEKLIADVYNALILNKELWESTLLIITFDECGGFYDHEIPPKTIAPDQYTRHYSFAQLGFRVPTLLISPYVKTGVDSTVYDHTSILKYLMDKWKLDALGKRSEVANNFIKSDLFTLTKRMDAQMIDISHLPRWEKDLIPKPKTDFIQVLNAITDYLAKTSDNKIWSEASEVLAKLEKLKQEIDDIKKMKECCSKCIII